MVKSLYYVLRATDLIEGGGDHEVRLGHGEWVLVVPCPSGNGHLAVEYMILEFRGMVTARGRAIGNSSSQYG